MQSIIFLDSLNTYTGLTCVRCSIPLDGITALIRTIQPANAIQDPEPILPEVSQKVQRLKAASENVAEMLTVSMEAGDWVKRK